MNIKLRDFESQVLYFNGMCKLPVAPYPTVFNVVVNERTKQKGIQDAALCVVKRLEGFKKTLSDELNEIDEIIQKVLSCKGDSACYHPVDLLTDLADLFGNIQVYCASEMVKFGIPIKATTTIIMASNFSKMQADGSVLYNQDGKVLKGPAYWKPEPQIKQMLLDSLAEHNIGAKSGK